MNAAEVKARARALGFDLCGVARAEALPPAPLEHWFSNGFDAGMRYLRERRAERLDPRLLLPGARSVIVLAASYAPAPGDPEPQPGELAIARYARGRDYHNALLKPARKLAAWLRGAGAQVYCEVDAGAIMEKAWAQRAGLGWIGKNGCLIHPQLGSWLLLGALVTDLELAIDEPCADHCGECRACLPACPTDALHEPRFVDARRCIAYHTIEHREAIPEEITLGSRLFGCDACQDVCPWNRKAPPATLVQLRARPGQVSLRVEEALSLTEDETWRRFQGTPLMRAGRGGLVRSALAAAPTELQAQRLAHDAAPGVREQAARYLASGNVSTAPLSAPASGESK